MTEEELKKLQTIEKSLYPTSAEGSLVEDVMGGAPPPGMKPPPTPPTSETKYGRMGIPMLDVKWGQRGKEIATGLSTLSQRLNPLGAVIQAWEGAKRTAELGPLPEELGPAMGQMMMAGFQPELQVFTGTYEDIIQPLYGAAAEIAPKDWPALLGYYQDQADVSRGLRISDVDVKPPGGFRPSEGWQFPDLRERIGELRETEGILVSRDQAYREALEAGDVSAWEDAAIRMFVDPLILADAFQIKKIRTAANVLKYVPKSTKTGMKSIADDAWKRLKDKKVLPSQSYPHPIDPSVDIAVTDAIDKIIDQGRPAAAAAPPAPKPDVDVPTVTQPDVPVSPTTQPVPEGQMQFLDDPAAYAMQESAVSEKVVPVSAVPEGVTPGTRGGLTGGLEVWVDPELTNMPFEEFLPGGSVYEQSQPLRMSTIPREIAALKEWPSQSADFVAAHEEAHGILGVPANQSSQGIQDYHNVIRKLIKRADEIVTTYDVPGGYEEASKRVYEDVFVNYVTNHSRAPGMGGGMPIPDLTEVWADAYALYRTQPDIFRSAFPSEYKAFTKSLNELPSPNMRTIDTRMKMMKSGTVYPTREVLPGEQLPRYGAAPEEVIPPVAPDMHPFDALAEMQRGKPEMLGTDGVPPVGRGIRFNLVMNVGDIINRMSPDYPGSGYDVVGRKAEGALRDVQNPDELREAIDAQIRSNAAGQGMSFDEAKKIIDDHGQQYADAYRELPTYNQAHRDAQEAAIAIGEQRYEDAIAPLSRIEAKSRDPETFLRYIREGYDEAAIPPVTPAAKAPTTPKPLGRPSLIREAFVPETAATKPLDEADIEFFGETLIDRSKLHFTRRWQDGKETLDIRPISEIPTTSKLFSAETIIRVEPPATEGVKRFPSGAVSYVDKKLNDELAVRFFYDPSKSKSKLFTIPGTDIGPQIGTEWMTTASNAAYRNAMGPVRWGALKLQNLRADQRYPNIGWRTLRQVGHILDFGAQINPSAMINKKEQNMANWANMTFTGRKSMDDSMTTNVNAQMATLNSLGNDVWLIDTNRNNPTYGNILNLADPPKQGLSHDFHDVFTYPANYSFSSKQKKWLDIAYDLLRESHRMNVEAGIDIPKLRFRYPEDPGKAIDEALIVDFDFSEGEYWPRVVLDMQRLKDTPVTTPKTGELIPAGTIKSREQLREWDLVKDAKTGGRILYTATPGEELRKTLLASAQARADMDFINVVSDPNNPYFRQIVPEGPPLAMMKTGEHITTEHLGKVYFDPTDPWRGGRFKGVLFTEELAAGMEKYARDMKIAGLEAGFPKFFQTLNSKIRFLQTGFDVAAPFIQGAMPLAANSRQWAKATNMSFRALKDPILVQKTMVDRGPVMAEMGRSGSAPFLASEFVEASLSGVLAKMPFAQRVAAMFNMFMDQVRVLQYQSYRSTIALRHGVEIRDINSAIPLDVLDAKPGLRRDLHEMAKAVDNLTGVSSARQLGVTETRQSIERGHLWYASNYRRGIGASLMDTFQGGVRGEIARDAHVRGLAASLIFLGATSMVLGGVFDSKANKARAPIIGDGSIFDPSDSRFMSIRAWGREIGLGGGFVSMYRLLGNIYAGFVTNEGFEGKAKGVSQAVQRFARSNTAPTTSAIAALLMNSDWKGDEVRTWPGIATLIAERTMMFWASPVITEGVIEGKPLGGIATGGVASSLGMREHGVSPRDMMATDMFGEQFRDLPEPWMKDMVLAAVNEQDSYRETVWTQSRKDQFNEYLDLSKQSGLSENDVVNAYYKIQNEWYGYRKREQENEPFLETRVQTENEKALDSIYEVYALRESRSVADAKIAELEAEMTSDQREYVERNLNRQSLPQRLYLRLGTSMTVNIDKAIEARAKYLAEIGRRDLIDPMRKASIVEGEPDRVLDDLQKVQDSGYDGLATDKAIAKYIKRRMAPRFSAYIDAYSEADRGKRGNMTVRSEYKDVYKKIAHWWAHAESNLADRQLKHIDDLREDGKYWDLEFILYHYNRHPNEKLRKNDTKFQTKYEEWRGTREPYGVG